MPSRSAVVRIGLGLFLLATAGLKLYGLSASGVPRIGWFAQPWVQLLTAEWELVLGAWLLSGWQPRLSWLAALVTFVAFACVSGYLVWLGAASCGCFGAIKTNPWWAFGADAAAIAVLAANRPRVEGGKVPQSIHAASLWLGSVALACGLLVGAGSLFFGSVDATIAKLRGDSLAITPYLDLGAAKPRASLEGVAIATNFTDKPIRLVGGTTDCSCVTIEDFPMTIPPRGRVAFRVQLVAVGDSGGQFTRVASIHTDCPSQAVIRFQLGCQIAE